MTQSNIKTDTYPTKIWLDLGNTRLKYWIMQDDTLVLHDAKEHLKAPNELLIGLMGLFANYQPIFLGFLVYLDKRSIKKSPTPCTHTLTIHKSAMNLPASNNFTL